MAGTPTLTLDLPTLCVQVPWGAKEVVLGMVGWGITFLLVGLAFIPVARSMAGTEVRIMHAFLARRNQGVPWPTQAWHHKRAKLLLPV